MDWPTYKALCERPDVMPRAMLDRAAALLPPQLAAALRAARAATPLPKPRDHKGDAGTDMFEMALSASDAGAILAEVEDATERGQASRGLLAAWREAECYIAERCQVPRMVADGPGNAGVSPAQGEHP